MSTTDPVHGTTTGGEEEEDSDNALIQDVDATKTIGVVMNTTTTTTDINNNTRVYLEDENKLLFNNMLWNIAESKD